jgi:peptidoglycan/LPS O-acetylase OafA/YrhL
MKYLDYTKRIAEETPPARNRVVDFIRVISILVVVFGHWFAASIWLLPDGEIRLMNSLEWIPYAGWLTWIVQVMPIFFFVGGYANGRALHARERTGVDYREWVTQRIRRLFTPVIPLLVVWTLLIVVLGPFLPNDVVRAGAMSATVPLWFIAVYVLITALAPLTYRWWKSMGLATVAVLLGIAILVDVLRFAGDVPGIGWTNFLFVWAGVHQLGYWWASREITDRPIPPSTGAAVAAVSLGVLIAITWVGWYPVAMVGIPGSELTNMTPPTFAIALLGVVQAGVIWLLNDPIAGLVQGKRVWHAVVAVSGVMMTIYLWHLTAMTLVASVFLFAFDGAAFRIEPGTTRWWLTRPIWIVALVAVTVVLVAIFAPFEWRVRQTPAPERVRNVAVGVLLIAGAAAAVSYFGLATTDATVNWIIPIAAFAGALIMGAYPARRRSRKRSDTDSPA